MKQLNLPAAALLCALACNTAGAQTNSIQYWSNHGNPPTITVGPNAGQACALVNITANPGFITDNDPDNFAPFLSVLSVDCEATIRTEVIPNPVVTNVPTSPASPRYAGYFLGGDFAAVSLLSDITLRTYENGTPMDSATIGTGLTLVDLGSDNFFAYFQVTSPFDDVEIEFGSLVTALEDLEVYYAFATAGTGTFEPVSNGPLPLNTLTFSAQAAGDGSVHLTWKDLPVGSTTVAIERSVSGSERAEVLASVPAAAGMFQDRTAVAGMTNYYRLRIAQRDGSTVYSSTAQVLANDVPGAGWMAYPNPADNALHIRLGQPGEYRVTLRNATGGVVFHQTYWSETGKTITLQRSAMHAAAGVYFLEVAKSNGESSHQRIALR